MDSRDTLIAPVRGPAHGPTAPRAPAALRAATRDERLPDRRGAEVLGRYLLLERLGTGGFGVVWRARDQLLDREVAVKLISLPEAADRERATREALATARLAHPAIVALYEACAEQDTFYLISELVHGDTLATLLSVEALCDEQLLEIGITLTNALLHAHQRGVIHRDIKPQNVLVPARADPEPSAQRGWRSRPQDGEHDLGPAFQSPAAKLTDFGGALLAGEQGLTRTGDVLGTLAYMAPEQVDGQEVTAAADLYSLALVLYEGLSGVNPVRGPTPAATARRIGEPLPPLERARRDLPRELARGIDRALDPDPARRGTLVELCAALAHGLRDGPRRSRRAAAPDVQAPRRQLLEDPPEERLDTAGWLTSARLAWLVASLAVCAWQLASGRPGAALAVLCAALPLVLLVRRPGAWWLAAALAPLLGFIGLAGAFPAIAGQPRRWRSRALLGALGYWWLRLAEPLLENRSGAAATSLHAPPLSLGLLLGLALWGLAAIPLPWIVRGRNAPLDTAAAILWATLLAAAALLAGSLRRGLSIASSAAPRDVVLGAALAAALAVLARAMRGPV